METYYAAHIRESDGKEQSVAEHCKNVSEMAAEFAGKFGNAEIARQIGLFHDIGKYTEFFQRRIHGENIRVDHSTAGAVELAKLGNGYGAFCIAGHHAGLPNLGGRADLRTDRTLNGRFNDYKKGHEDYSAFRKDISSEAHVEAALKKESKDFAKSFYTRMLFSCLVDADYLDTEDFMKDGAVERGGFDTLEELQGKLNKVIEERGYLKGKDGIQKIRSDILRECIEVGKVPLRKNGELWSLTVPTGGGKTIASLAFALERAVQEDFDRVIYVIPYCSIIDQTVAVFEEILGKENVLAHYSEADYEDEDGQQRKKLAAENWDSPIVVTTAVQFFESLYASRPGACRKLHNIVNSIVIFDEAQTFPREFLLPCVQAIAELTINYRVCNVLCTATQPALGKFFKQYSQELSVREICSDPMMLHEKLARVHFKDIGVVSDDELAERLNVHSQVLCIVATKKMAQDTFERLEGNGNYHLSTLMTPEHRKSTLKAIREKLAHGETCRVVSTSLVEAGVDLDFLVVYREMAGIDNNVQAGGRCNREGKRSREESVVYLFKREQGRLPAFMKRPAEAASGILKETEDIASPEAVEKYFNILFHAEASSLDLKGILPLLARDTLAFRTAAEKFQMIPEGGQRTILIPRNKEAKQIEQLLLTPGYIPDRKAYRIIGRNSVNIYENQFWELRYVLNKDVLEKKGLAILSDVEHNYSDATGLVTKVTLGEGEFY